MEIIVLPLFSLVVAICFSGMFAKHNRRRKRLTGMTLEHADRDQLAAFEIWRKAARRNSQYADAAAYCASLMWVFPFLFLGLLVLPFLANGQRRKAKALEAALPTLPKGLEWLDAKDLNVTPPDNASEAPKDRRRWKVAGVAVLGVAVVASGLIAIAKLTSPHPKIDGRPLPEWVEKLSDLDPEVRWEATLKLNHASPEQLERYRDDIEDAANHDPNVRELLRAKFP